MKALLNLVKMGNESQTLSGTYSSLALSSAAPPALKPFRGLQASNSTSKIRVALHVHFKMHNLVYNTTKMKLKKELDQAELQQIYLNL